MAGLKRQTVLVTGANGYIGAAVARAFVRHGFITYGLVRNPKAVSSLVASEIVPLLGSASDLSFLPELDNNGVVFDVIASTTEDVANYVSHYNDIVNLLCILSKSSLDKGVKPLVLFSSGCKDYGMSPFVAASPEAAPHTEDSALTPVVPFITLRAHHALKIFNHSDLFDAVVLRPTNVYGYSSSYYGYFFQFAQDAKKKGVFEISQHPQTMLHAMHVDDCAEGYVALAEHGERKALAGECFNISAHRYETLEQIANALVKEYDIEGGVKWLQDETAALQPNMTSMLLGFSQWVASDKLRTLTGWKDRRGLFTQDMAIYRRAHELAVARDEFNLQKRVTEPQRT